jgi:NitT/TauT family transport system ATP-binding protein
VSMWQILRADSVNKDFQKAEGGVAEVLREVSFQIERGKFFTLLGPSGCGKSTVLNIVAGFEHPTSGQVLYDDTPITTPGTDRTVIFQDVGNALFPWLNVRENVEFGLKVAGVDRVERSQQSDHYLRLVGLSEDEGKFPFELSGGMKQRVQIARALANDPNVLLADEPFAALDAITKKNIQVEFRRIWQKTRKTILYITHDIMEALLLGTHLAVMTAGPKAGIKEVFKLDLKEPRSHLNPDFAKIYTRVEELIDEEVRRMREQ